MKKLIGANITSGSGETRKDQVEYFIGPTPGKSASNPIQCNP